MIGEKKPSSDFVTPPLLEAHDAEYLKIGSPLSFGESKVTVMRPLPRVTVGFGGASGTPSGTTSADSVDVEPPTELKALTVHVYVLPLVRPVTVSDNAVPRPVFVPGAPPSEEAQSAS